METVLINAVKNQIINKNTTENAIAIVIKDM